MEPHQAPHGEMLSALPLAATFLFAHCDLTCAPIALILLLLLPRFVARAQKYSEAIKAPDLAGKAEQGKSE